MKSSFCENNIYYFLKMSSDIEQYRIFTDKLSVEEDRSTALNNIKDFLEYKPASEAVPLIRNIGISKIIKCLNESDKTQLELTCEVLKTCFEKFEPGEVIKLYTNYIMYLLRNNIDGVRRLAIDEICKTVTKGCMLPVPQYIDVYVAVGQMVCDSDVGIANKAVLITSNLTNEAYPKVLEEMKIALEGNSSSKCNAFEVIINISAKSPELLNICVDQGYISFILSELYGDDILYELNILELLTKLAITPHGINYLVKQGTFQKISEIVKELHKNPFGSLLIPGYMKFLGSIAYFYPKEIFEKYPILLDLLFDTIESNETTILPIALDTFGFIGATIEGKLCLVALGSKFIQNVERLGSIIRNSPTEIKVRALLCLASLISVEKDRSKDVTTDKRVTLMTREWFRSLCKDPGPMEVLYDICKNPFPDIKMAALTLLDAVCQHQWGAEMVANVPGFIEYILDRTVDYTNDSKYAKYNLIKRLSQSSVFDENIITRLQKYVEQGPYYAELENQVAMEGD